MPEQEKETLMELTDDKQSGKRLGFREIVPGAGDDTATDHCVSQIEIPEFDLNKQMMAGHRRLTSKRRMGPKKQHAEQISNPEQDKTVMMLAESVKSDNYRSIIPDYTSKEENSIIADIVRRDIEHLCQNWTETRILN